MPRRTARRSREGRPSWPMLLVAGVGAPVAWTLHLGTSYALVGIACNGGLGPRAFAGGAIAATIVLGGAALASAVIAYRMLYHGRDETWREAGEPDGRVQFVSRSGLLMSAIFLLLIVLQTTAPIMVPLCPELLRGG